MFFGIGAVVLRALVADPEEEALPAAHFRFPRSEPRRAERGAIGVGDWIEPRDLSRASEREGDLKGFMALTRERLSEHGEEGERCVGWFRALIG